MNIFQTARRVTGTACLLLGSLAATSASAQTYERVADRQYSTRYDYADVVDVQPVYRNVSVERPVRECWQETVTRDVRNRRGSNTASTIAGTVIGGVIGHQFGSGRGNDAATIAGALIGAAIGSDGGNRRDSRYVRETESYPVERCDTRIERTTESRIDGYDVTYVYNGQRLRTRMASDPGRQIKVRVSVAPAR